MVLQFLASLSKKYESLRIKSFGYIYILNEKVVLVRVSEPKKIFRKLQQTATFCKRVSSVHLTFKRLLQKIVHWFYIVNSHQTNYKLRFDENILLR